VSQEDSAQSVATSKTQLQAEAFLADEAVASRERDLLRSLGAGVLTHLEAGIEIVEAASVAAEAGFATPADILRAAVQPPITPPLRVHFEIEHHVRYGHALAVVGSAPELGAWHVEQAPLLRWTAGDVWMADFAIKLVPGQAVAYKFVEVDSEGHLVEWAPGPDWTLKLVLPGIDADVRCADTWMPAIGRPERIVVPITLTTVRQKGGGRVTALRRELREEKARNAALMQRRIVALHHSLASEKP